MRIDVEEGRRKDNYEENRKMRRGETVRMELKKRGNVTKFNEKREIRKMKRRTQRALRKGR